MLQTTAVPIALAVGFMAAIFFFAGMGGHGAAFEDFQHYEDGREFFAQKDGFFTTPEGRGFFYAPERQLAREPGGFSGRYAAWSDAAPLASYAPTAVRFFFANPT